MKRFVVGLISTILAFSAGLVTASSWASESKMVEPVIVNALTALSAKAPAATESPGAVLLCHASA